jgi:hypothetical protein
MPAELVRNDLEKQAIIQAGAQAAQQGISGEQPMQGQTQV